MHSIQCSVPFYTFVNAIKTDLLNEKNRIFSPSCQSSLVSGSVQKDRLSLVVLITYIFHSDNHGLSFRYCLEQANLETRQCIIWEKNSFTMGRQDYQWRHEPALYGWKEGAAHYFINDRTQDTVVDLERTDLNKKSKKELIDLIKNIEEKDSEATTVIKEE